MSTATLNIGKNRFFKNFTKDKYLIFTVAGIIIFWTLVYLCCFYKPKYESFSKVWVKDLSTANFVDNDPNSNSSDKTDSVQSLTSAGNPLLTQIELIKSHKMRAFLFNYLKSHYPNKVAGVKNIDSFMDNHIDADNKLSTDMISIGLSWDDPKLAKELLEVFLKEYVAYGVDINKRVKIARRQYIDEKIAEIEPKLMGIRKQIKTYKEGALAIDVEEQARQLVSQKTTFSDQLENVNASIASTKRAISQLERNLSLNTKDAINAVALGSYNKNLVELRTDLNDSIQQYSFDSAKMSDSNPKVVALKNKIEEIKKEIQSQIKLSIGANEKGNQINIYDPVREKLVTDLATNQTNLMSLLGQKKSIIRSINKINKEQTWIPGKKYVLDNLEQEERNLSNAYDELKTKQIEARIKEAETVSNIVIVDNPNLPVNKSFPTSFQIIILGCVVGMFSGVGTSLLKTYFANICESIEAIELVTKKSVIGVLPWIDDSLDKTDRDKIKDISFEKIISNLMIKCYKNDANVLTFSSNSLKKASSQSIYMLACQLNKLGQSVVIVDADFRNPSVRLNMEVINPENIDFSDAILNIEKSFKQQFSMGAKEERLFNSVAVDTQKAPWEERLKQKKEQYSEIIVHNLSNALTMDNNGVYHLSNNKQLREPYEYFGGLAFNLMIQTLKEKFDWVLIETPSILVAPETLMISKLSDGFVLFTSLNVTYSELANVVKTVNNAGIPFLGSIVRDNHSNLHKEYLTFLK